MRKRKPTRDDPLMLKAKMFYVARSTGPDGKEVVTLDAESYDELQAEVKYQSDLATKLSEAVEMWKVETKVAKDERDNLAAKVAELEILAASLSNRLHATEVVLRSTKEKLGEQQELNGMLESKYGFEDQEQEIVELQGRCVSLTEQLAEVRKIVKEEGERYISLKENHYHKLEYINKLEHELRYWMDQIHSRGFLVPPPAVIPADWTKESQDAIKYGSIVKAPPPGKILRFKRYDKIDPNEF